MRIHLIVIKLCNTKTNIKYFTFKKEYSLSEHSWIVRFSFNEDMRVIFLGVDKTKSILFSKRRKKENIHINRRDTTIIQHTKISYLGCLLDEDLSGESMANKVLGKINGRLKFLHRKNEFLTAPLRRLLCNALVQPHFDYASSAWYPNLKKLKVAQNKCIRFCLQTGNRKHVGYAEYERIRLATHRTSTPPISVCISPQFL